MNSTQKPIVIFRHSRTENAGYFSIFLDKFNIKSQLICIDQGEKVPTDASQFAGLVFMGGVMSVNDDLPWIEQSLNLIRQAIDLDIPVLGHCLGGQLMSKALGGVITKNPVKELGWVDVQLNEEHLQESQRWFGQRSSFNSFHWHGETFSIPEKATLILSSEFCQNQAFVYNNIHLGMQCHIEMIPEMINTWVQDGQAELEEHKSKSPNSVQLSDEIQMSNSQSLETLHQIAEHAYTEWIKACKF